MVGRRKRSMFQCGARAYCAVTGSTDEVYACPLCLTVHLPTSLENGELTEEHVPPGALGGRVLALTCRTYNVQAGSTLDGALSSRERLFRFPGVLVAIEGRTERVDLEVAGEKLVADFTPEGRTGVFRVVRDCNNPATVERVIAATVRSLKEGQEIRVRPRHRFRAMDADIGDLRIVYLVAFAALGYAYIRQEALEPVRMQIREPRRRGLEGFSFPLNPTDQGKRRLTRVQDPLSCLLVALDRTAVIIPWSDRDPGTLY